MSRYPDETRARFDQQFVETTAERNARLRDRREQRALAAIEAHREWDVRREVLEEAAAVADAYRCGHCGMYGTAGTAIRSLIGPEPTNG